MTDQAGQLDQASRKRLLNATAVMASGTMVSRVLGFGRTMLLAFVLGNGTRQIDAFNLATVVPNSLYMIFAGGALNTVLVPQIVRHIRHDADGGEAFVNRIMTAFGVILAVVTVIAVFATPAIMWVWSGATWHTPAMAPHWDQLVLLASITMPQLFFYGAFFMVGQVLNARDHFGPMMWAPIVNNVVSIAVLGLYLAMWGTQGNKSAPFTDDQVFLLGVGSTLGIVLQTVALIPAIRTIGFRYRPRWDLKGQGLGETFHLAKWMLGYVLLTQLAAIVVSKLASDATATSVQGSGAGFAAYNEAYLVWILPHSLLTVSLATAMLPSASRLAAVRDMVGVAAETMRTMRLASTFLLPASVGFLVLAWPFADLVFGHGAGARDAHFVAVTLQMFALGLVPYTVQYVYLRGFYALEDTRTPFLLQIVISGANAALAVLLVWLNPDPAQAAPRLALSYSAAYLAGALLTHWSLRKRLPTLSGVDLVRHLARLLVAVLPAAAAAALITWGFGPQQSKLVVLLGFLLAAGVAVVLFFLVAKRLNIVEITQLVDVVRRRGRDRDEVPSPAAPLTDPSPPGNGSAPLLTYPDPADRHPLSTAIPQGAGAVSDVQAGQVLEGRYRLDEVLNRRAGTLTWLAFDQVLSRPVLIHLLSPDEPRTLEILDEACTAARATDSRFLRVLDAVLVEDRPFGSYIVCEYAAGQSLELALQPGPLTEREAAWVVREVAEGLVGMHAQGLYHRQLNLDTIVITASGNVKIVGFLVEAALHPEADDDTLSGEVQDVEALGKVLYAAILGRWPQGSAHGLAPALRDGKGRLLLPRQVKAGVSPALNAIVDQILSPAPEGRRPRLRGASEVAAALTSVLGGADVSHDLADRLRYPIAPLRLSSVSDGALLGSPLAVGAAPEVAPFPVEADSSPSELTEAIAFDPFDEATAPFTPVPPPTDDAPDDATRAPSPGEPRRWGAKLLALLFAVVLVAGLVGVVLNQLQLDPPAAVAPAAYRIVTARDFDPRTDGGDDRENPRLARQAVDGRADTAWTTERYGRSSAFNGRKPGAGVIVDLGSIKTVGWVRLDLGPGATQAELRIPIDVDLPTPSVRTGSDWRVVQSIPASSGDFTVRLSQPVETRFLLVYLTRLPQLPGETVYQGRIVDIAVGS